MIVKQLYKPKFGIDVSEWQGQIGWDEAASRIDFAIIRLGFGQNTLDRQAKANLEGCTRLGIPYGVYWFSYAHTPQRAAREGANALAWLEKLGGKPTYPIFFDWEYDSRRYAEERGGKVTAQLLGEMTEAFCRVIEEAGWQAGVYANQDYRRNAFPQEVFQKYPLWLADLSGDDQAVPIHQYSFTGRIPGIAGDVDLNRCYGDFEGTDGTAHFIRQVQQAVGAGVDGIAGPETRSKVPMVGAGYRPTHPVVAVLQLRLAELGYREVGRADGIAGPKFTAGVKRFQRENGLTVDGIVGENTWAKLLGS